MTPEPNPASGLKAIGGLILRSAAGALATRVSGTLLAFVVHMLLARRVGPSVYGTYVYAFSWVAVLSLASRLGLEGASLRFVPHYVAEKRWDLLAGLLRFAPRAVAGAALALGLAGAVLLRSLASRLDPHLTATLALGFAVAPLMALMTLGQSTLCGFKRAALAAIPPRVVRPLVWGLLLLSVYGLERARPAAEEIMLLHLLAAAGAFMLAAAMVACAVPRPARNASPAYRARTWLEVAGPLFLMEGMFLVLERADILMLGSLHGAAAAGRYACASRISMLVIFGALAVNAITAPLISEYHGSGRRRALQHTARVAARAVFFFTLLVGGTLAAGGRWVLSWFGQAFTAAYLPLLILLAGQTISSLCGSVNYLMSMTGHHRTAAVILGAATALNLAANLCLIPRFGAAGAATATAGSVVAWNLAMVVYVRRRLGIDPTVGRTGRSDPYRSNPT